MIVMLVIVDIFFVLAENFSEYILRVTIDVDTQELEEDL